MKLSEIERFFDAVDAAALQSKTRVDIMFCGAGGFVTRGNSQYEFSDALEREYRAG